MTILGPLLLAGLMIVPVWLATKEKTENKIQVVDESFLFVDSIPSTKNVKFEYTSSSLAAAQKEFYNTDYTAILYIPVNIIEGGSSVKLFYKKPVGIGTEQYIETTIEKQIFDLKLLKNNINKTILKNAETSIRVLTEQQQESGQSQRTDTGLNMAIGLGAGVLIYMFIFLYGVQVMQGVIEEKTNRIVEVIISSVKPFQLMMGKIVGVALVGLTQFILWIILTFGIYSFAQHTILKDANAKYSELKKEKEEVYKQGVSINHQEVEKASKSNPLFEMYDSLKGIDFGAIMLCFLFYFLGGYLLYSALFAAIGAAIDNEADKQQFMLPITIPLIFSFAIAQTVIQDPGSPLSFWFSIIPFTSPVVMMVRLPFGVPAGELALSMSLLVLGFIATTWLAGRIYRTGILMYGKKVTYSELWKWLFYKG